MKKFIIFFILCITMVNMVSHACGDSLNVRHYEDRYMYPEAIQSGCQPLLLDYIIDTMGMISNTQNTYRYWFWAGLDSRVPNMLEDFAQSFTSNVPVSIAGVSGFIESNLTIDENGTTVPFDDTTGILNSYFEIRDASLDSVLAKVSIPLNDAQGIWMPGRDRRAHYTELFFDSAISVSGSFYVVWHSPDTIASAYRDSRKVISSILLMMNTSEPCLRDYPSPLMRNKNNQWVSLRDYANSIQINNVNAIYLFPILAEDSTESSVENVDMDLFTHLFPNPANDRLNINCGYKIQTFYIHNELGCLIEHGSPLSNSTSVDISKYKQGTYLATIITSKGKITKKFIKR